MKGKSYHPAIVVSQDHDPVDFYDVAFKFPLKRKAKKKFKVNTREFSPVWNYLDSIYVEIFNSKQLV
jgi:hypothetical protein